MLRSIVGATLWGGAPSIEEVGSALREASVPREWLRSARWTLLLPPSAAGEWAAVAKVLAASFGLGGRAQLASRRQVKATISASPFSADGPGCAHACTGGRNRSQLGVPAPGEWQHDANQLGRVLKTAVQQNLEDWLADPVGITVTLIHPTYIRSYLEGATEVVAEPRESGRGSPGRGHAGVLATLVGRGAWRQSLGLRR